MASEETTAPVQPEPVPKKRKGCLIFLLVIVVLFVTAVALVFGSPRRWEPSAHISTAESVCMQQIIGKLTSTMVTEDGQMAERAVVELTAQEINTLLKTGLRAARLRETPNLYYDAEWKQGALELRVCRVLLPFLAVNLDTELVPAVGGGKITLHSKSCWLGSLPFGSVIVDPALAAALERCKDKHEIRAITEIVESLDVVKGDSVRMTIRPKKIKLIVPLLLRAAWGR